MVAKLANPLSGNSQMKSLVSHTLFLQYSNPQGTFSHLSAVPLTNSVSHIAAMVISQRYSNCAVCVSVVSVSASIKHMQLCFIRKSYRSTSPLPTVLKTED